MPPPRISGRTGLLVGGATLVGAGLLALSSRAAAQSDATSDDAANSGGFGRAAATIAGGVLGGFMTRQGLSKFMPTLGRSRAGLAVAAGVGIGGLLGRAMTSSAAPPVPAESVWPTLSMPTAAPQIDVPPDRMPPMALASYAALPPSRNNAAAVPPKRTAAARPTASPGMAAAITQTPRWGTDHYGDTITWGNGAVSRPGGGGDDPGRSGAYVNEGARRRSSAAASPRAKATDDTRAPQAGRATRSGYTTVDGRTVDATDAQQRAFQARRK